MSFSFGFSLGDDQNDTGAADHQVKQAVPSSSASIVENSAVQQSRDHLISFRWIDNLRELLERRRTDQIIYDEVALHDGAAAPASEDSCSFQGHQPSNDNHLLRVVDLSRSSFSDDSSSATRSVERIEASANDLVPAVYEGGLKVWESSMDLVRYMHEEPDAALSLLNSLAQIPNSDNNRRLKFLELGCGHGLPSCYILRLAAHLGLLEKIQMVLADYNDFVLTDALVSNIVLNMANSSVGGQEVSSADLAKCLQFGSGDWFGLLDEHMLHQVDWIAAAETLYSVEAAKETAYLISRLLRPETGQAWVASKRYYFGVGGGVDAFCTAAESITVDNVLSESNENIRYKLDVETVQVCDNGNANIRELLLVRLQRI